MYSILSLYFFVEFAFIFILMRKYKGPNTIVFGYILFFIYAQSAYLDYLLFDVEALIFRSYPRMNVSFKSLAFLKASTCYFLFMTTYGLMALALKSDIFFQRRESINLINISSRLRLFILLLLLFFLLYHMQTYGMDRVEKKDFVFVPLAFIVFYIGFYLWGFLLLYLEKKGIWFYALTAMIFYHTIYSFEREFIVLAGLFCVFKFKSSLTGLRFVVVAVCGFLVLTYWKLFYLFVVIGDSSLLSLVMDMNFNLKFSSGDSAASMSLLTNFFDNNIYQQYYLSYITNPVNQFVRIFLETDYKSLAEYSTDYFTGGNMGTAFSMILESVLNFGIFGPILLPVIILKLSYDLLSRNFHLHDFYSVILIFLMVKLVRTEVAVLVKLYVLPIGVFHFIITLLFKKLMSRT